MKSEDTVLESDGWGGRPKRYCLSDSDPAHAAIVQAIAESFWGEGCYPFNAATGHVIKFESERAALAVENALIHLGRLRSAHLHPCAYDPTTGECSGSCRFCEGYRGS